MIRPLLHFLAIGGLLFVLDARTQGVAAGPADPPAAARTDQELLLEEARALGLQRSDALVRRRLVRNMRFLVDDPSRTDDALFAEALELGMDESDLVVRRRLVQKLVLAVQSAARRAEPTEGELRVFLAAHAERFEQPARVRLTHVFLSRDRRGAALDADARALLERLDGVAPERAAAHGDPLPLPAQLGPSSQRELAKTFGEPFARAVFGLEPGRWSGPVPSSYGLHLVQVQERIPARRPGLASVRGAVREALLEERADAALREGIAWLRARR